MTVDEAVELLSELAPGLYRGSLEYWASKGILTCEDDGSGNANTLAEAMLLWQIRDGGLLTEKAGHQVLAHLQGREDADSRLALFVEWGERRIRSNVVEAWRAIEKRSGVEAATAREGER